MGNFSHIFLRIRRCRAVRVSAFLFTSALLGLAAVTLGTIVALTIWGCIDWAITELLN